MQIHEFGSTGEAYDCTQCFEEIKNGDLLVIECEQVIGIADTWPVAVTKLHGELHTPVKGVVLDEVIPQYKASIDAARKLAAEKGWPTL